MAYSAERRRQRKGQDAAADHAEWQNQVIEQGFAAGSKDWLSGRHSDPYLPNDTTDEPTEMQKLLSIGWAAGQDYHFRRAASDCDRLMRNLPY